jgi:autotransporter-associated beta strand protein
VTPINTAVSTENWLGVSRPANWTTTTNITLNSLIEQADIFVNNGRHADHRQRGYIARNANYWLQTKQFGQCHQRPPERRTFVHHPPPDRWRRLPRGHRDSHQHHRQRRDAVVLVKDGSGQLILDKPNTYSGGSFIPRGAHLRAERTPALGTGLVTVARGGQAIINSNLTVNNNFVISGDGAPETTGLLGAIRALGNTTVSGTITLNGPARLGSDGTNFFTGVIQGAGTVSKIRGGLAVLSGENTWTGDLVSMEGDIQIGNRARPASLVWGM